MPDAPLAAVEQLSALYLRELAPDGAPRARGRLRGPPPDRVRCSPRCCPGSEEAVEAPARAAVRRAAPRRARRSTTRSARSPSRCAPPPTRPRRRRDRVAAYTHLRAEARTSGPAERWRVTGDLLYLIENPAIREAFFPTGVEAYAVEPATPADRSAIEAIAARHEPPASLAHLRAWLRVAPGAFRVARAPSGAVAAFLAMVERAEVPHALYREDPVTAAWREALRADPLEPGAGALFTRWAIAADSGEAASPATAALWLDIKRDYVELRPALRRVFLTARDLPALCPALEPLGFATVGRRRASGRSPPAISGRAPPTAGSPGSSRRSWACPPPTTPSTPSGASSGSATRRVELSPREWDLLAYLRERAGRPVPREALARDVWGHAWTGGSANAIEAVVSSLRRKLGDRAGALQTVRGVGYRLDGL